MYNESGDVCIKYFPTRLPIRYVPMSDPVERLYVSREGDLVIIHYYSSYLPMIFPDCD